MTIAYPRFKAAACHVAPVFLNAEATIAKAAALVGEAARNGAELVVFPESLVPGFPIWVALRAPIENHDFFRRFAAEAVRPDGPELALLRSAACDNGVHVSIGISEGTTASVGCLWNANLLIGPDGNLVNLHRKLVPTFYEKLVWANGDGRGLRVCDTPLGRIGMLICGENTNPLARYALMAEGEQVHISTYPPIWPTRPPREGGYDIRRAIEIRAGAHSFEAKAFNIVSSGFLDAATKAAIARTDAAMAEILETVPRSVSMIIGPDGAPISEVMCDEEGIAYAEIDTSLSVEQKQFHDVTGYYNRFDIFDLEVDRRPRDPARFVDQSDDAPLPGIAKQIDQGDDKNVKTRPV